MAPREVRRSGAVIALSECDELVGIPNGVLQPRSEVDFAGDGLACPTASMDVNLAHFC